MAEEEKWYIGKLMTFTIGYQPTETGVHPALEIGFVGQDETPEDKKKYVYFLLPGASFADDIAELMREFRSKPEPEVLPIEHQITGIINEPDIQIKE